MLLATLNTPDKFQHTAARRRLQFSSRYASVSFLFQHTAARRRLPKKTMPLQPLAAFQHTAARRRLHFRYLLPFAFL